jgi:hypothetical protein
MSEAINANVDLNTNHTVTANANTNTNHAANANTNQHPRDAADEKEVEPSTTIDVDADIDEYDHHKESDSSNEAVRLACRLPPPGSHSASFPSLLAFFSNLSNGFPQPQAQQHPPAASASSELPQLNGFPRLIPSSEIQARGELAANMSVDIEAGVLGGAGGSGGASGDGGGVGHGNGISNSNSKRTNRKLKQQHHPQGPNASQPHEDPDGFHYLSDDHREQELELSNYSEPLQLRPPPTSRTTPAPSSTENSNSNRRKIDWVKSEKNWDTSVPLTRVEQVGEGGCWVGWKVGCFFLFLRFFLPRFFFPVFFLLSVFLPFLSYNYH